MIFSGSIVDTVALDKNGKRKELKTHVPRNGGVFKNRAYNSKVSPEGEGDGRKDVMSPTNRHGNVMKEGELLVLQSEANNEENDFSVRDNTGGWGKAKPNYDALYPTSQESDRNSGNSQQEVSNKRFRV